MPASANGAQRRPLTVAAPPAKCPCVVRAATAGEQLVATVPIAIAGVGIAPVVGPAAQTPVLEVDARLASPRLSFLSKLQSSLGGRTRRTLVLKLTNTADAPLSGITSTAAVARSTQGGEPLQLPNLDPIGPRQTRTFEVPVSIHAPAFGSYVVYGTVYGSGPPVTFSVSTHTAPWALFILIVFLAADLIAIAAFRIRRARARAALPAVQGQGTTKQTEVEQTGRTISGAEGPGMVAGNVVADR